MVDHVVMLQIQPEFASEIKMMNRIMRHVIKQITGNESCKEWHHQLIAKQKIEQHEKQSGQRNADRRNHHQPLAVAWIIMVHTVKDKMDAFADFSGRQPVKNKTVKHVFGQ